ncbi:hypothetical protein L9F63_002128, partial [Diploptera punctata]
YNSDSMERFAMLINVNGYHVLRCDSCEYILCFEIVGSVLYLYAWRWEYFTFIICISHAVQYYILKLKTNNVVWKTVRISDSRDRERFSQGEGTCGDCQFHHQMERKGVSPNVRILCSYE